MGLIGSKSRLRRKAGQRGFIGPVIEEIFTTAAILGCFVAPIAGTARAVGPRLADEMDHRIQQVMMQEPDGRLPGESAAGEDPPQQDGVFERVSDVANELSQAAQTAGSAASHSGKRPPSGNSPAPTR